MPKNLLNVLKDLPSWDAQSCTEISTENFDSIFESWRNLIKDDHNTQAFVQAFFEDLANKFTTDDKNVVIDVADKKFVIDKNNHSSFWNQYVKPENLSPFVALKDRLVDLWSRRTNGEFFTPEFYANLGHKYLEDVLKDKLYQNHWWDMCCGTGNLTKKCPDEMFSRLYMSTLNEEDISILTNTSFNLANIFVQDFLNTEDTYSFLENSSDWVFILNPPYSSSPTVRDEHKKGVSNTIIGARMKDDSMNKAASNLTTQFLWKLIQIAKRYNINITIGMFTQISFAMNPSYSKFYQEWKKHFNFINGFCFHCSEFEGTTGEWPVVFSVWSTSGEQKEIDVDVYENHEIVGRKSFSAPNNPLSKWIDRPKNTVNSVPLTSAITVATQDKTINLTKLPEDALGFAVFAANDVMHSKQAYLLSGPYANGSGWGITKQNMENSLMALGLRAIIKGTWLNDRDQFNTPDILCKDYEQFKNNMIMWVLFSNFNHSASLNTLYENQTFDIKNHFYWRDGIIFDWMKNTTFSQEAQDLLSFCNALYDTLYQYKSQADIKYQLDRDDAGWYQWRKALCGQNSPNLVISEMYKEYKQKHKILTQVLVPKVYEFGVLPNEIYFSKMKNTKQLRLHSKRA